MRSPAHASAHLPSKLSLGGTRATRCTSPTLVTLAMSSEQAAWVSVVNDRPDSFNDVIEDADNPTKEDSSERVTCGAHAPRAQHGTLASVDVDPALACEFDCGPPTPRSGMINKGSASSCWVCDARYVVLEIAHLVLECHASVQG